MNILIAGGNGFLGKALTQTLLKEGHQVIAIDSKNFDLSKPESIEFLQSIPADFIFHLAGKTGIAQSWKNPLDYYKANVDTTRNILEYGRLRRIPIHYVSGYVYGNQGSAPLAENGVLQPNNPYGHSKLMGEELCRFYSRYFSLPVTISRPFNVYGPYQPSTFFIPVIIEQLCTQPNIKVRNLQSKRDYVFVQDVADALIAIMQKGTPGECYNIGTGSCFSCQTVIEELQKLAGTQKPVIAEDRIEMEEILHAQADIKKICSEIGWHPRYSLSQGLAKCFVAFNSSRKGP